MSLSQYFCPSVGSQQCPAIAFDYGHSIGSVRYQQIIAVKIYIADDRYPVPREAGNLDNVHAETGEGK